MPQSASWIRVAAVVTLALSTLWPKDVAAGEGALSPAAIVAGRYVAPDGTIQGSVAIVIADGKIKNVVPSNEFNQIENVIRRPESVVSPGLIDLRSAIGAYGKARESALAVDPGASAASSLDVHHEDFRRALEGGITTALIAPEPNNIVSGAAVITKTHPTDPASILRADGPLVLALGPTTWDYDREPTSRIGAMSMLRQLLAEAKEGKGHRRLQDLVSGKLDGLVFCGEPMDVSAALRTLAGGEIRYNIVHNSDEHSLVDELAGSGVGVIVGPYGFALPPRTLALAGRLSAAEVPVAFAANMPAGSAEALRMTAALAVRYGMDSAKARQAMSTAPARMAGVADRVGAIQPGLDADLVVFSGDPLRLDSQVLEVYVNGVRVYGGAENF